MSIKEAFALRFSKLSFTASISDENARSRSQFGTNWLTIAVCIFIAAVAYADSRVDEISLGYLYVLPVALSALVNRLRTSFYFVAACVALHDLYGPEHAVPDRILLNLLALLGLSFIALLVHRLGKERQALTEIIRRQHDEMEQEIRLAAQVQQRLLPAAAPQLFGIEIAAGIKYHREMGGDYYDFIELGEGDFGIAVGDVSGKGTAAAILMPTVEVALRFDALERRDIAETFHNLNRVVNEITDAERFITLFYAKLRAGEKSLEYVNAGHNPPLVFHRKTQATELLESVGTPLGMFAEMNYAAKTVCLETSDVLVFYTDGLSEAENESGEPFGIDGIERVVGKNPDERAAVIHARLLESVSGFRGSDNFDDDLTLIVLKFSA